MGPTCHPRAPTVSETAAPPPRLPSCTRTPRFTLAYLRHPSAARNPPRTLASLLSRRVFVSPKPAPTPSTSPPPPSHSSPRCRFREGEPRPVLAASCRPRWCPRRAPSRPVGPCPQPHRRRPWRRRPCPPRRRGPARLAPRAVHHGPRLGALGRSTMDPAPVALCPGPGPPWTGGPPPRPGPPPAPWTRPLPRRHVARLATAPARPCAFCKEAPAFL